MQVPRIYSLESYEPTVLKPEETIQNDLYIRTAFTEKIQNRTKYIFNFGNIPNTNPQNLSNTKYINNNGLNRNYIQNQYTANIPTNISIKNNPFVYNNLINSNQIQNTLKSVPKNNSFFQQKINRNNIKYIQPINNKAFINYPKNQISQFARHFQPQNIYRNKSSNYYPGFNHLRPVRMNNYNKNIKPIYRKIVYRKKN